MHSNSDSWISDPGKIDKDLMIFLIFILVHTHCKICRSTLSQAEVESSEVFFALGLRDGVGGKCMIWSICLKEGAGLGICRVED